MADLEDALARIYAIEAGITGIAKVWEYYPPQSQVITDTPCFVNTVAPTSISFDAGWKRTQWAVHPRLMVSNADSDEAAAIAMGFVEPIIDAFASHIKLSTTGLDPALPGLERWMVRTLRFSGEQPVIFPASEVSGRAMFGLDFFIDLEHHKAVTLAP